jgi:hypothetical protein
MRYIGKRRPIYIDARRTRRKRWPMVLLRISLMVVVLGAIGYAVGYSTKTKLPNIPTTFLNPAKPKYAENNGQVVAIDSTITIPAAQATDIAKQANGKYAVPVDVAVTKVIFHYRSQVESGEQVTVYGRAYIPTGNTKLPVFAFAPGTTGIGDQCAASLEVPAVANWANYDSLLIPYAAKGYAVVTTDYEGMRDDSRIHHYMVGEVEGRAVLDSIRALGSLSVARDRLDSTNTFVGGYSQGGHAAFWADKINHDYAPDVTLRGIIGFGPVMSVRETLADITVGANINWFGPYILYSYSDYYDKQYGLDTILLPQWRYKLGSDVLSHCIDTDIPYWGHDPAKVYQPGFLAALKDNTLAQQFPDLARNLAQNEAGDEATSTAKLINQGHLDNVVLPRQSENVMKTICANSTGPASLVEYPTATHYDNMSQSFADTITWMGNIRAGRAVTTNCRK